MKREKYIRPESFTVVVEDRLLNIVDATNGTTKVDPKSDGSGDAGTAKSKQSSNLWVDDED
jgi:hypothetical protein